MTKFKEVTDLKEPTNLSQEVSTNLNLHLEMGMRQIQGKILIWWNLPDKWPMCEGTIVTISDYKMKWVQSWNIYPSHKSEILTEHDWGNGWSTNLYVYLPGGKGIEIMRTPKITDYT